MDEINLENAILIVDEIHGIYVPKAFSRTVGHNMVTGATIEQFSILESGPDHEEYWEVWDEVLNDVIITDRNGMQYTLYQDGSVWAVPINNEQ